MEVIEVAKAINAKIEILVKMRGEIRERAEQKATAISEYDKALAKEIISLREKGEVPATLIEKVAKGNVYKERYDLELADGLYKSIISNINAVQSELNGLQSINRHLEQT